MYTEPKVTDITLKRKKGEAQMQKLKPLLLHTKKIILSIQKSK